MEGKFKFFKGLVIELALFIYKAMARVLDNICKEIIKISVTPESCFILKNLSIDSKSLSKVALLDKVKRKWI